MLTLKKFELQISDKIIHRGREYYENDAVVDLEETEKDCWHAEVMGTDTYVVEVILSGKGKIKSYLCDCPYDGDICKHVVAVLFLLREEFTNEYKGDVAGSRREYADLAIKMEKVMRAIPEGKDEIIAVAKGLIRKYSRRPAMIEELNAVIKKGN